MKKRLLSLLLLCQSLLFCAAAHAEPKHKIGIYHWGGEYLEKTSDPLIEGAERVKESGAEIINITISPYWDYKNGDAFETSTLTLRAQREDYRRVLTDPAFKIVVLTAFDWQSYGTDFAGSGVSNEFSDFVLYLATVCNGQEKTFVIKDWEVENRLGIDTSRVDQPKISAERWQSYLEYVAARQRGVEDGKRRAQELGLTSVTFRNAVETVNIYPLFFENIKENSVLWQMSQRKMSVDLISWSAWQATPSANPLNLYLGVGSGTDTISRFLKENKTADGLFLGEIGVPSEFDPQLLRYIFDAVEESEALFAVKWNLYNAAASSSKGFGSYDEEGKITPQGTFMKELLLGTLPQINEGGVVDAFTHERKTQSGIVEIYGTNLAKGCSDIKVEVSADTEHFYQFDSYLADVLYVGEQINAQIPRLPELMNRTVYVRVVSGSFNSNFQKIFFGN